MRQNKIYSYTAASSFPVKVIQDRELLDSEGRIRPRHLQLNITNKCNLNCSFCSCDNRQKAKEMSLDCVDNIANKYKKLGTEAVTLTGGGEPLLHPNINEIINIFANLKIKVGLVTNGLLLRKIIPHVFNLIDWIRVSFDDARNFSDLERVLEVIHHPNLDWSFSYVLSDNPNWGNLIRVISYANKNKFTHVRLVSDLLDIKHIPNMEDIKKKLSSMVDDSLVIYQGRKDYTKGSRKCFISLLKPVVDTDGSLYPCCGVQYALDDIVRAYNRRMSMGSIEDINNIFYRQSYFNGEDCKKCYYSEYNKILQTLIMETKHKEFV